MSRLSLKGLQAAAGAAAGEAVYVDDVFSTYLYTGNATARTITNGIDLDGEGGLVWIKTTTTTYSHNLFDTERGATKRISSDTANSEITTATSLTSFNSDGFSIGSFAGINVSNEDFASWTFRKQPGFFDVVTYTGDGVAGRTVSHNLGSVPGMIIVKSTSNIRDWAVFHRSIGSGNRLNLNKTDAASGAGGYWNSTDPTDTEFTVGNAGDTNFSGETYVAYLFAHDAQDFGTDSDESIIKCGSYTGTGSAQDIDLGFEPQWILIKRTSATASWTLLDSMRGIVTTGNDPDLHPNDNYYESQQGSVNFAELNADGIKIDPGSNGYTGVNSNGSNYIYLAIRRPHKPAEEFAATDLFAVDQGGTESDPHWESGFPVDMAWHRHVSTTMSSEIGSRLTGTKYLKTDSTATEATDSDFTMDYMDGWYTSTRGSTWYSWMFRRAPGFFDVVTYTGNGFGTHNVSHNLGVKPELVICKSRSIGGTGYNWPAITDASVSSSSTLFLNKNSSNGGGSSSGMFTDTTVNVGSTAGLASLYGSNPVNASSVTYIMYLFATVPGISKVGSYSGTGSNLTIDCGFSSGARFVLIKSTTFAGNWYLWDSVRGITTGNDYHLKLNDTSAQITDGVVDIEPDSSGFILNGPNANINSSGNDYIFLAIA